MTKAKYVKITNVTAGGSHYVQPVTEIHSALDGELDCLAEGGPITLKFEAVEMTDEEYAALPEFPGH